MRIVHPEQIHRYDGKNVFVELMANAIAIDKVNLNFSEYNTKEAKGNRVMHSVAIYLGISDAAVLAHDILSGRIRKLAERSKEEAKAAGSRYPKAVYTAMGGTTDAKRDDKKPESRIFKILPGNMKPWVLTAEKGPGRIEGSGLIAPEYRSGQGDCIIRIPMTDEMLKSLALEIQGLHNLWTMEKFAPLNNFDPGQVKGYDDRTGMRRTKIVRTYIPEAELQAPCRNADVRLNCSALPIDKILLSFIPWDIKEMTEEQIDAATIPIYINIHEAKTLAHDILSGRMNKKAKNSSDPIYTSFGGSKVNNNIVSRTIQIIPHTENGKPAWILRATQGPGHLSQTGLYVPEYDDNSAAMRCDACFTDEMLRSLAIEIKDLGLLWDIKKFGPVIAPKMDQRRKQVQEEIAKFREGKEDKKEEQK